MKPAEGYSACSACNGRLQLATFERGFHAAYRHLAAEPDLDVVFHDGDNIYEFGPREHDVVRRHWGAETTTLSDYRLRYS